MCEHSLMYSRGSMGFDGLTDEERSFMKPVRQSLVRTHPVTGRKSLYLSSHAGHIVGWLVPESRDLLRDLVEHATQRENVYIHRWRQYDLVMWDNRQTMHRVRRFDEIAAARHAPHHRCGRGDDGEAGRRGLRAPLKKRNPAEAGFSNQWVIRTARTITCRP